MLPSLSGHMPAAYIHSPDPRQGHRQHWRRPLFCEAGVVLGRMKSSTDVKHLLSL